MKTTFSLDKPKVKLARQYEATKSTISKYLKRERKKTLPEGEDFWDFACRFGPSADEAGSVHLSELNDSLDAAEKKEITTFYVEIVAKAASRTKRPK